jgi:uncharacterized protein (UPF0218 family)
MTDYLDPRIAEKIRVDFFINGKKYAMRQSAHVPTIGDEVRFHNIAYKVVYRIWIYDEKEPRAALEIEQVQP